MEDNIEAKITLRVPLPLKEKLKTIAASKGGNLSSLIRGILETRNIGVSPEKARSFQSDVARLLSVLEKLKSTMISVLKSEGMFISRKDVGGVISELYAACFELEKIEGKAKGILQRP